eukprot:6688366-Alexandrium_andersonii.AAC.1
MPPGPGGSAPAPLAAWPGGWVFSSLVAKALTRYVTARFHSPFHPHSPSQRACPGKEPPCFLGVGG